MKTALTAALTLTVLAGANAASANITDKRFEKKTKAQLEELQVPESDVESVKIVLLRRKDERGPEIRGAESWIRLNSCTGHLVIVMNRSAYVLEAYTRGDCSIPGLKNY